jgi:hypothetical protein
VQKLTVKRVLEVPASAAWEIVDAFGSVYKVNPIVRKTDLVGTKATGRGAKRVCEFYNGKSVTETIVQYDEGRGYTIEMSEITLPLKSARTRIEVTSLPGDRSQVTFVLEFAPKFGPAGWLMAQLKIKPFMREALMGFAKGIEDHIKTGKIVGEKGKLIEAPHAVAA